jgi:hypothetical protein
MVQQEDQNIEGEELQNFVESLERDLNLNENITSVD